MKAITTTYHGPTTHRPARIIASDMDGNRSTVPADGDFPYDAAHRAAAVRLCETMRWPGADTLVGGTVKQGSMAWVFTHEQDARQPAQAAPLPAQAPTVAQCPSVLDSALGRRCQLLAGHDGAHRDGPRSWTGDDRQDGESSATLMTGGDR